MGSLALPLPTRLHFAARPVPKIDRAPDALQREDALGEKVALPERRGVLLKKFIPRSFASLRTRIVASVLEDALHGVSRDRPDAELLEFAENAGVPLVIAGLCSN